MTVEQEVSVARVAAWLARQVELALAEVDLSLPQFRVLNLLAEAIALPSSLADNLDVRRPTITAVVDGLVSKQLVVRRHDAGDRRKVTHEITRAGRKLLAEADRRVEERLRCIAATLDDEREADQCMQGLASWAPALLRWRNQKLAAAGGRSGGRAG